LENNVGSSVVSSDHVDDSVEGFSITENEVSHDFGENSGEKFETKVPVTLGGHANRNYLNSSRSLKRVRVEDSDFDGESYISENDDSSDFGREREDMGSCKKGKECADWVLRSSSRLRSSNSDSVNYK
ncbi:7304_t:CDS:1, partial [Racocetra fulgida]